MKNTNIHWSMTNLLESAEAGYDSSQFALAELLWEGRRVKQDLPLACYWYEKAARNGHVKAKCALAFAYATGSGVPISPENAFYWYNEAAMEYDTCGLRSLAACYANGFGTEKNLEKAYQLTQLTLNRFVGLSLDPRGFDRDCD
jgi:TPR repeat protein